MGDVGDIIIIIWLKLDFLQDLREYSVSEQHSVDAELTKLTVEDPQSNSTNTCNYHSKGGFGHATMGVRSVSLELDFCRGEHDALHQLIFPGCFISIPHPYN